MCACVWVYFKSRQLRSTSCTAKSRKRKEKSKEASSCPPSPKHLGCHFIDSSNPSPHSSHVQPLETHALKAESNLLAVAAKPRRSCPALPKTDSVPRRGSVPGHTSAHALKILSLPTLSMISNLRLTLFRIRSPGPYASSRAVAGSW